MGEKVHTGEHILFRALSTVFPGMTVKKVEFGKRNYFLVHYDEELKFDLVLKAELIANQIIQEGRPVRKIFSSRKEAQTRFPQLRVRWDRITEETVCIVEIEGFDWAACVGDHVENTREIDYIVVTRINSVGKKDFEIEFAVAEEAKEEALKRSSLAREVTSLLKTSWDEAVPTLRNLKESEEYLTESLRLLTARLIEVVPSEQVGGISLHVGDLSGGDRQLLQREAARLARDGLHLVVFVEQVKDPFLVVARSPSVDIDCRELLITLLPSGKGGGKPEFVTASSPEKIDIESLKMKIYDFLRKREE